MYSICLQFVVVSLFVAGGFLLSLAYNEIKRKDK